MLRIRIISVRFGLRWKKGRSDEVNKIVDDPGRISRGSFYGGKYAIIGVRKPEIKIKKEDNQ